MNEQTINNIILEDRSVFYQCEKETFLKKGTSLKHRESLDGKSTFYLTKLFEHHFITCGKELFAQFSEMNESGQIELDEIYLSKKLTSLKEEMSYPHFLYRKDRMANIELAKGYHILEADPSVHEPLQEFLDGCTEDDIDDALIELDDPDEEIRLVYHQSKPIGYAGYRRWGINMGDVGILIQDEHRKKGLGKAAVAEATKACINNKCLPFYRTSSDNKGSQRIARSLGYEFEWVTTEYTCKL